MVREQQLRDDPSTGRPVGGRYLRALPEDATPAMTDAPTPSIAHGWCLRCGVLRAEERRDSLPCAENEGALLRHIWTWPCEDYRCGVLERRTGMRHVPPSDEWALVFENDNCKTYMSPDGDEVSVWGKRVYYKSSRRCTECEDASVPCPGHDLSALDWARRAFPCADIRYLGGKGSARVPCKLPYRDHPHRSHNWKEPPAVAELVEAVLND